MSEIAVQAASVKAKLLEIAKQSSALAAGLQNAAPGDKDAPNASIQYLAAIAEALAAIAEECDELSQPASAISKDGSSGLSGM